MSGGQTFICWDISHLRGYLLFTTLSTFSEETWNRSALPIQLDISGIILLFIFILYSILFPVLNLMFHVINQIELIKKKSLEEIHLSFCSSVREFLQSNPSHLWEKHWGDSQMWEVGFWLHWQLWGTEVSQSRKWLDLPCGRLAHPDNNPHSSVHPGSPQVPTEGHRPTAERQGQENLLFQVANIWIFSI